LTEKVDDESSVMVPTKPDEFVNSKLILMLKLFNCHHGTGPCTVKMIALEIKWQ